MKAKLAAFTTLPVVLAITAAPISDAAAQEDRVLAALNEYAQWSNRLVTILPRVRNGILVVETAVGKPCFHGQRDVVDLADLDFGRAASKPNTTAGISNLVVPCRYGKKCVSGTLSANLPALGCRSAHAEAQMSDSLGLYGIPTPAAVKIAAKLRQQ